MNFRKTIAFATRADIKSYLYFLASTGLCQTYQGWVARGRPNPHVKVLVRKDPTTRAEITDLFGLSRQS